MARRMPLPSELVSIPFSVATARSLGITADRLRSADLVRPFHGVRATREPTTVLDSCRAYRARMHPDHAFSHVTAAVLWDIPLPQHLYGGTIHVAAPAGSRAPSGKAIRGHSVALEDVDVRERLGLRVTSPATTWVHISEYLEPHDALAAADFLLTGNPFGSVLPLATRDELEIAHLSRGSGRGSRTRRLALSMAQEGPLSRPESILRYLLLQAGSPMPQANPSILDARGSFLAMPDLAWSQYTFVIEYEGDYHREKGQFRRDIRRIERLVDEGWSVMKVSADDLFDRPDETVARAFRRLAGRGWGRPTRELRHIGQLRR